MNFQTLAITAIINLAKAFLNTDLWKDMVLYAKTAEEKLTDSYITGADKKNWVLSTLKEIYEKDVSSQVNTLPSFVLSMFVDIAVTYLKTKSTTNAS